MSAKHRILGLGVGLSALAAAAAFAVLQPDPHVLPGARAVETSAPEVVAAVASGLDRRAAVPEEDRSGFYSAPAGQVMRFDYRATTKTAIARRDGVRGEELVVALEGRMHLTVLARRDDEVLVEVRFPDTDIEASHGDAVLVGSGHEPLRQDLQAATVVRLRDDGTTLGYLFPEGAPAEHRNFIRTLWSAFRFVARDDGGRPWRTREADAMGLAEYEYAWRKPFVEEGVVRGGVIERRRIGNPEEDPVRGSRHVRGEGTAHLNPSLGWIERAYCREELEGVLADVGMTTASALEATCELREVDWHPAGSCDLWSVSWQPADGSSEQPENAIRLREQRHAARLADKTLEALLAELAGLLAAGQYPSSEAFAAKVDLAWILRLRPEALARLDRMLGGMDPALARLALSAAGAAETAAAQTWLAGLFADQGRPQWLREDAVLSLVQVRAPEPSVVHSVAKAVAGAAAPGEARRAGELALGAMLSRAGSSEALSTLIGLESRARAQGGLVNWLEALGNAGGPEVLGPARPYLDHPRTAVRVAATSALRSVPGETAAAALIGRLADAEAPVRLRAAEVLSLRPEPAALQALDRMLTREPDVRVRAAAVSGLASRAVSEPQARALLERVARSDPSQDLRRLAAEALSRR